MSERWGRIMYRWFRTPGLTPTDYGILAALATYANDDGECWPAQERIAQDCGSSRMQVSRTLKKLEQCGIIETRENRAKNGIKAPKTIKILDVTSGDITDVTSRCNTTSHKQDNLEQGYISQSYIRAREKDRGLSDLDLDLEFEVFMTAYPLDRDRKRARTAYAAARREGVSAEELLEGAKGYAAECQAQEREKKMILLPVNFIRQERYRDVFDTEPATRPVRRGDGIRNLYTGFARAAAKLPDPDPYGLL